MQARETRNQKPESETGNQKPETGTRNRNQSANTYSGTLAREKGASVDALLAALPLNTLSVGGLCALAVVSLWRGWIVPAPTVRELVKMRDDRIAELVAERIDNKATITLKDEALRELTGQSHELLELAKTGNALMRAIAEATGRDSS
jgi:hypothetical protein